MSTLQTLMIERLQAYCLAKAGIIRSIRFGENNPSYSVLGGFLSSFVQFFLDETPIRLKFRCNLTTLEAFRDRTSLQIAIYMKWDRPLWKWVDLRLEGQFSEEEIIQLLDASYTICMLELNEHDFKLAHIPEQVKTLDEAIEALITLNNLTARQKDIRSLVQRSVLIQTAKIEENNLAIGQSKIGGSPDLPEAWLYPTFDGQPLTFLAQVNLAEIPSMIQKTPLPSSGILYFFSVFGWQLENGDPHPTLPWEKFVEPGFSQVLYFDGQQSALQRWQEPTKFKTFRAAAVQFMEVLSIPHSDRYIREPVMENLDWNEQEINLFEQLYFDFCFVLDRKLGALPRHKLLGYADPVQDVFTKANMRLLCQIDTDFRHTDMTWGDGGMIYFTIKPSDLVSKDFANIRGDFQTG